MISVDRAEEGMVVSSEITDRRGRLLVPAGKVLEEKHLRALKMWGIDTIEIEGEGDNVEEDVAIEPWASLEADRHLEALFTHADLDHPFISALYAHCKVKVARRIQAAGEADASSNGASASGEPPGPEPVQSPMPDGASHVA